jgi:hypothetical protein
MPTATLPKNRVDRSPEHRPHAQIRLKAQASSSPSASHSTCRAANLLIADAHVAAVEGFFGGQ